MSYKVVFGEWARTIGYTDDLGEISLTFDSRKGSGEAIWLEVFGIDLNDRRSALAVSRVVEFLVEKGWNPELYPPVAEDRVIDLGDDAKPLKLISNKTAADALLARRVELKRLLDSKAEKGPPRFGPLRAERQLLEREIKGTEDEISSLLALGDPAPWGEGFATVLSGFEVTEEIRLRFAKLYHHHRIHQLDGFDEVAGNILVGSEGDPGRIIEGLYLAFKNPRDVSR